MLIMMLRKIMITVCHLTTLFRYTSSIEPLLQRNQTTNISCLILDIILCMELHIPISAVSVVLLIDHTSGLSI